MIYQGLVFPHWPQLMILPLVAVFFLTALEYMLVFQLTFPIFCPSCMIFDRLYFVARTARFPAQLKMFFFFWLVEFFGVAFCLVYTLTM